MSVNEQLTTAVLVARETALLDVKGRGKERTPYRNADVPSLVTMAGLPPKRLREAAARVTMQLTANGPAGREVTTISARAGLPDFLVLLITDRRQIGHQEVAALCGISPRTAWTMLHELVAAGVLWTVETGRKGLSMTTWALAPRAVKLLVAALDMGARWLKALSRTLFRLRKSQLATSANSIRGGTKGAPPPAHRAGDRAAPTLAERRTALADPADRCSDDPETQRSHCAYCRRGVAHP